MRRWLPNRVELTQYHIFEVRANSWVVTDAAASVRGLAARGVHFERFPAMDQDELGIWTTPGSDLVAWFKEPDGNVLSLTQFATMAT